ncbi:MAG: DUF4142 domain-containing protein, partial [Microbacterium sp.]|nr:DUF4142 domain-containing protein [Microbacterium sp.]
IADTAFFAPEAEFYIFDDVRYEVKQNSSFYSVDSEEGAWNTGRTEEGGNLANKTPYKGGYFPVSPVDKTADLRDDITLKLIEAGFILERSHHEVGTGGQQEINYRFDTMVHAADDILKFKYIVKNTSEQWGKVATFMPKPLFGDNGSGMHTHQSLWLDGKPLFYDEAGYGGLSDIARWYIGGLLAHAPAVLAFTNPTLNSYKRLVKGYEAPVNLVYSAGNRSAAIRIPITGSNPKAKRIEFRAPDASGNPYLAFAAQMITDHTKTSADIKGLIAAGDVKAELPTALDSSSQAKLDDLNKVTADKFAATYDPMQVSAHKDAVSLFERYSSGGDNPKLKDWAG